jgi:GTPase SAR1 family protein
MAKKSTIEIPISHQNEWKSKRYLEEIFEDYCLSEWIVRDYGIDSFVQFTSPIRDSNSLKPDGKYFLLQLKSTENLKANKNSISFTLPVKKIFQWYNSNLPVLLTICEIKTKQFFYLWVDEHLINDLDRNNAKWVQQDNITLKIPNSNVLNKSTIAKLKSYVLIWKLPQKKKIEPGTFFQLKHDCKTIVDDFSTLSKPFKFTSINESCDLIEKSIDQSIYKLAIAGPSRAGKSTLVNALIRRKDVSPQGFFQTTGVPIQIVPDKEEFIEIYFKSRKIERKPLSKSVIEKYASQDYNEDNHLNVALLSIHLKNSELEKGLSIFDLPGLNDYNDDISNYAWNTATKANAIFYVIDASTASQGGFSFTKEYKNQIKELIQSSENDKVFLVLNKVNSLSEEKLSLLKTRIEHDLKKTEIFDQLSQKVYYISAEDSLQVRTTKSKKLDSVKKLEDDFWDFVIKENKIGISKLAIINKNILSALKDFESLLNTGLLNKAHAKKIKEEISTIKSKIPELVQRYRNREAEMLNKIDLSISNQKNNILSALESHLKTIKKAQDFPNNKAVRSYLAKSANQSINTTNIEFDRSSNNLKDLIDSWTEDNLKQLREMLKINSEKRIIDLSGIETIEVPNIDVSSSLGIGLLAGVATLLFSPAAALWAGLSVFFGSFFFTEEERLAKRRAKTMEAARNEYDKLFGVIKDTFKEVFKEHSDYIKKYADRKILTFLQDMENQLKNVQNQITVEEEEKYTLAYNDIKRIGRKVEAFNATLNTWYNSI